MYLRSAGALLILMLFAGTPVSAQQSQDAAILLGRAIGPVAIGMDMAEVKRVIEPFGRTYEQQNSGLGTIICNQALAVFCVSDYFLRFDRGTTAAALVRTPGRAALVSTSDKRFIGDGGLRVGILFLPILQAVGMPTASRWIQYQWLERGLMASVGPSSAGFVIYELAVFAPVNP